MDRSRSLLALPLAAFLAVGCAGPREAPEGPADVPLLTHHGERVRFRARIRGEVVLVNFMFTTCNGFCPRTTRNLVKVQEALGDHLGRDVFMYSISLDPTVDTPEVLERYAEAIGARPGWTFLTGERAAVERLRRRLGIYDLDPALDADKTQHAGLVVCGNESTGAWTVVSGLAEPDTIVASVFRLMRGAPAAQSQR